MYVVYEGMSVCSVGVYACMGVGVYALYVLNDSMSLLL